MKDGKMEIKMGRQRAAVRVEAMARPMVDKSVQPTAAWKAMK